MLETAEIESRKPVWMALSDLWLDTELAEADLCRIARVLAQSKYDLDTLRSIYLFEVAPVVYQNLLCVAGAWAGFDPEWLFSEIIKRTYKAGVRHKLCCRLRKPIMTYATKDEWKFLERKVQEMQVKQPAEIDQFHLR